MWKHSTQVDGDLIFTNHLANNFSAVVAKIAVVVYICRECALPAAGIVIRQTKLSLVALPGVMEAGQFRHVAFDFDLVRRGDEQDAERRRRYAAGALYGVRSKDAESRARRGGPCACQNCRDSLRDSFRRD